MRVVSIDFQGFQNNISCVKTPGDHECLSYLSNLNQYGDESQFFVSDSWKDGKVGEEEN